MLSPDRPALILAPMEGVTDAPMRAVQGACGAFTFAVSEFLRVSHTVPPKGVFLKHIPELRTGCRTATGLPVQVQLLGGDADLMATAAEVACEAGALAIDINFGCPAKTVNRHDGGATLLKYPKRIREIVSAVRAAVPAGIPVSAKLRLGWDTTDAIFENAEMVAEGGASWITIHGRTREAGYAPPIHWSPIGRVRELLKIPVVANGDIWNTDGFRRCRDETGCIHFMLGRGALASPGLARSVAMELGLASGPEPMEEEWPARLRLLIDSAGELGHVKGGNVRRLKQWLSMAARFGTFAHFDAVKRTESVEELFEVMERDSVNPTRERGIDSIARASV
jgi:tRNA-dihydrouridine synthase C